MTAADPVHTAACDARIAWTTINASEALPGIVTPLTWSVYHNPVERAMRAGFHEIGVLRRSETVIPPRVEDRVWTAFYGRPSVNLNWFRAMADRMPGSDGDSIEEQIFGQVREGVHNEPSYRRWPVAAVKMPAAVYRLPGRLRQHRAETDAWWRATLQQPIGNDEAARAQFADALARFERIMHPHLLHSVISQAFYGQLVLLAEAAGEPGLERTLVTGYGDLDETTFVGELWEVGQGARTIDRFLADHGYHGPGVGELVNLSWREQPAAVETLVARYRTLEDPKAIERRQATARHAAEARLREAVPRSKRASVTPLLKLAATFLPLRGTGKTATAQCLDVMRRAARHLGDDTFFLRAGELQHPPADAATLIAARRARHEQYAALELPELWDGVPVPGAPALDGPVAGMGVSTGTVEGVARVILAPSDGDDLAPGEIIVCVSTDPSWASLFLLAAGIVIDIGGPLSHGAIVARELGIPCVIGARTATRQIRTGDRIRLDGSAGTVDTL